MPLSHFLAQIRPAMELLDVAPKPPICPSWAIFFSASNGQQRAHIVLGRGDTFEQAWQQGVQALQQWQQQSGTDVCWLRVDLVDKVEALRWDTLEARLAKTKRNYFRYGLSLDPAFCYAMLE